MGMAVTLRGPIIILLVFILVDYYLTKIQRGAKQIQRGRG